MSCNMALQLLLYLTCIHFLSRVPDVGLTFNTLVRTHEIT
jgi:hypothetical protein